MKTIKSTREFIQVWCKDKGIAVIEDESTITPVAICHEGRREIRLPRLSSVNHDEWQRVAYHESSHLAPENLWHYEVIGRLGAKYGRDSVRYDIANVLIDNLAERTNYLDYRGRAQILSTSRSNYVLEHIEAFSTLVPHVPKIDLLGSLCRYDMSNREGWMLNFVNPIQPVEGDPYIDELNKLPIEEVLKRLEKDRDTASLVELVERIAQLLDKPKPKEEDQDGKGKGKREGKEKEEGQGEGEAGDEGADEGSSGEQGGTGESEPGGDKGAGGSGEGNKEGGGEAVADPAGAEGAESGGSGEMGSGEDAGGHNMGGERTAKVLEIVSKGLGGYAEDVQRGIPAGQDKYAVYSHYQESHGNYYIPKVETKFEMINSDGVYDNEPKVRAIARQVDSCTIGRQLRKHLQLRAHGRAQHGVTRGKVSCKSLHRLYLPAEAIQPRVFQKKIEGAVKLDSAVSLLVDLSGSMGRGTNASKYNTAAAAAIALANVLSGLRVPHEILGFSETRRSHMMYAFKTYQHMSVPSDELIKRFCSSRIQQDHNTDGESVQFAAERLMLQKQRNKVLIVLSDGQPAGHYDGDGAWYLRQVIDDIENHSPIKLVGIGIESSSVEGFYKNCKVIHDIKELEAAVLETLKASLLGH